MALSMEQLIAAKEAVMSRFDARGLAESDASTSTARTPPNLVGAGIGDDVVKVYVRDEAEASALNGRNVQDVPLDFVTTQGFSVVPPVSRARATTSIAMIMCGESMGHYNITAGTAGCAVKDDSGNHFVLSNNHVLADSNNGKIGDAILRPGQLDGGTARVVAALSKFVPIDFQGTNTVDAAIAEPVGDAAVDPRIPRIGKPGNTIVQAFPGQQVQKHGRTTKYTSGSVLSVNTTAQVNYNGRMAWFDDQIVAASADDQFGLGGDSGSLVVDMDGNPVGLLFAGDPSGRSILNPMQDVLIGLSVSMV